jgi:hypothetical protein
VSVEVDISSRPAGDRPLEAGLNMHPQLNAGIVVDTEDVHVGKANKHPLHAGQTPLRSEAPETSLSAILSCANASGTR